MKRILAVLVLALGVSMARADSEITNYFNGYVFVASTNADMGDTALTLGTPYVCFPVTNLSTFLSTNQAAMSGGDVRAVLQAIINRMYLSYAATAATNRPSGFSMASSSAADTTTAGQIIDTYRIGVTYSPSGATLPSD